MKRKNSIFFDHDERQKEYRRISLIKSKINFPKPIPSIFLSRKNKKEVTMKISRYKKKKKTFILKYLYIIRNNLEKYSQNLNQIYSCQVIENILKKNSTQNSRFKEMLLEIDDTEFIHKYYEINKGLKKLKNFGIFSKYLHKFYPCYLGMSISIYKFMNHYLLVKQDLINRMENKKMLNINNNNNSFSLNKLLEKSSSYSSIEYTDRGNYDNNKKENKKKHSIKEIYKLIKDITKSESNNSNTKKYGFLKTKSIDSINIKFSSPILKSNKKNDFGLPVILKKTNTLSQERNKRYNFKTFINSNTLFKNFKKEKKRNKKIKIETNSELLSLKKKDSFNLNDLKNNPDLILDDKSYIPKYNIERTKNFKNTKEFILNSKKDEKKLTIEHLVNDFIKNPTQLIESIEENKNKEKKKKYHKRYNTLELNNKFIPYFLRNNSNINNINDNSKIFLATEGLNYEILGSPKLIQNKLKKRCEFWSLGKKKNSNISSNYYYSSFFNSDKNQTMKKTFLKFDNVDSISSSHKSYLSNKNSLNNSIKKGKISSTIKFKKHLYNN